MKPLADQTLITVNMMLSYLPRSNQRRPAPNQAPQPSTYLPQTVLNQSYGFQPDGYNVKPVHQDQYAYHAERPSAVAHRPTRYDQYAQAYTRMASAGPTTSQHGTRVVRNDYELQRQHPDYTDVSSSSSTAAVVGSRAPQSSFDPQQSYQDFHATARTAGPYSQPARPQLQYEPFMNQGGPDGWTTGPAPEPYNRSYYQQGGYTQHPMNPRVSFMPNPAPILTPHNSSHAWLDPAQSMYIPQPVMYAPAPALQPTSYSSVPVQPLAANVPHPPEYQSQPPVNIPSGDISTNAVDQGNYPQANNNENIAVPAPVSSGGTGSSRKNRRGKGKGKGRAEEA